MCVMPPPYTHIAEEPGSPSATDEPGSPTSGEEVQEERTATDHTTQRILNIMAEFLEGEVRSLHSYMYCRAIYYICVCTLCHMHVRRN